MADVKRTDSAPEPDADGNLSNARLHAQMVQALTMGKSAVSQESACSRRAYRRSTSTDSSVI